MVRQLRRECQANNGLKDTRVRFQLNTLLELF